MNDAESEIRRLLDPGESLVWSGMPIQGVRLRAGDVVLIPFSLLWGGFAVFWETMVLVSRAPWFMALFGMPFVAIGLYLIVGRFFVDAKTRARTFYGITDRRVVVATGLFSRRVTSIALADLVGMQVDERTDCSGTISFGPGTRRPTWFSQSSWPGAGKFSPPSFDFVERVRDVHALVTKAREALA
jgi:hypothetical protein